MDTITKAAQPYTPPATAILHQTEASLTARPLPPPVHLVQYDQTLPILQVSLYSHGQPYTVPAGAAVNVRMDKLDGHYVYNPALGLDNTRTIAYIAITQQMTTGAGCYRPIVEVVVSGGIAGTAPLALQIDPNPVPQDAVESTDEYKTVQQLIADAQASAEAAANSAAAAKSSETAAEEAKGAAETAQGAAEDARDAAGTSAETATNKAKDADDSAKAALASQQAAKESETAAQGSAETAQQQANTATQQATDAKASAQAAAASAKTAQQQAETATQMANAAGNRANAANEAAHAAQNSATAAQNSATTAQQQANTATQKANDAEESAQAAANSAGAAAGSATTATTKANEAAQSAAAAEAAAQRAEEIAGGTADEAKKLETARAIDGVDFDGTADIMHYATCSTAAGTAAKAVTVTGYKLVAGAWVTVKFGNTNTAANPTLNVSNTGAKAIHYRGAAVAAGVLAQGRTYGLVYNGTQYELIGDIDTNTTYGNATTGAAGLMSAADKSKLDGIAANANNYSLPLASASTRGGVKTGYTANDKNYPVQLSNEQMYVNVPWINTTYANMKGATASAAGAAGLVPAPAAGAQAKYLRGDGTWATPPDTHANHWTITVPASGWTGSGPYTNTITVSGMTASTNLGVIKLAAASVGVAAAELAMSQWDTIDSQVGKVVLTAKGTKPAANFTIDVWEVK